MSTALFRVSDRIRTRLGGVLLTLLFILSLGRVSIVEAFEPDKAPVKPVPSNRWGSLQPAAILGDQSAFEFHGDPKQKNPFYFDVDIENGWLFVATGRGLQIYDARGAKAASPTLEAYGYGPDPNTQGSGGLMPAWYHSDEDFFLKGLDVPTGTDDLVAVAGEGQGFSVWDTSVKSAPAVHYQDEGVKSVGVHTLSIGGKRWAYNVSSAGLFVHDLEAAKAKTKCLDNSSTGSLPCGSVYRGKIATFSGGLAIDGAGSFVAIARAREGFEVYDVSNPTQGVKVMAGGAEARGIAMWQVGSAYYLATGNYGKVRIYNVSCITSGSCGVPSETAVLNVPNGSPPISRVTISSANGTPYLYVGGDDTYSCAVQREYLFNVSNPANPQEITPKVHPDGYWGWYYERCSTGFNWVSPKMGKFYGGYFYRAAYSLLDVHGLAGAQPPVADFSWSPSNIYTGDQVQFNDLSTGNPAPHQWAWTFQNGVSPDPTQKNPVATFDTPGSKTVTLRSTNSQGTSDVASKSVVVLDPQPRIASVKVEPTLPTVCQPVTLTAEGVTGRDPLTRSWTIQGPSGPPINGTSSNQFVWNTTATTTPGTYTATFTASNSAGTASKSVDVILGSLLPIVSPFTPTADPFTAGTVTFHLNVPGATEWNWDFDGDGVFHAADWTNDPVKGPNPTHTYATLGAREVRVKVRNCVTTEVLSEKVTVDIKQITPLEAKFAIRALCGGSTCFVDAGTPVTFLEQSTGAEAWYFDWDGNNVFEQGPLDSAAFQNNTILHTYSAQGTFSPKLKVTRGTEQHIFTLPQQIVVGSAQQGSISVSGPTSGKPEQALSFSASGSGSCKPSANGWSWSAPGGSITGGTTASATISWTSTGNKTITITNSACSGLNGSKSVAINSDNPPPPPPTGLKADFTFSPAAPIAGQALTLNGSISQGSPTSYTWEFGDSTGLGVGAQVSHVFANPGTYQVRLSVAKAGNCAPAPFCESSTTKVIVVGSGEPTLVPSFSSEICTASLNLVICTAEANKEVTFSDTSAGNVVSRTWSFGDGESGSGTPVKHTYKKAGIYPLTLTVSNGSKSSTLTRNVIVNGGSPVTEALVLPWIAKTVDGSLVQSSDLYLHNPGTSGMDVTLEFRRRGTPENQPPASTKTIAPNATLFVRDVIKEMFGREDITGFVGVNVDNAAVQPIMTAFNTTFSNDGTEFGQTIPGFGISNTGVSSTTGTTQVQHLVGLNDNSEGLAYFGLSNPSDQPVTYRLRFFDNQGRQIGTPSGDVTLSRFGFKQYQAQDIRTLFGITDKDDYRVVVESTKGAPVFPYAANLRRGSKDPSFVAVGTGAARVHLIGALSTPGINDSLWQSDLVIANTSDQVVISEITFTGVGVATAPTDTVRITLQPGETQRLDNVIDEEWGIRNSVGVLTIESDAPNSLFPVIQGESYENTVPSKRYGQTLPAMTDAQAAGPNQGQYLVGLRQDAKYRTTFWVFNPGTTNGEYDVIYRSLDGQELGRVAVTLPAGKMRQFSPGQHRLPTGGVKDGFTVQILVRSGKALAAAQVVNTTNDPAYIQGERR